MSMNSLVGCGCIGRLRWTGTLCLERCTRWSPTSIIGSPTCAPGCWYTTIALYQYRLVDLQTCTTCWQRVRIFRTFPIHPEQWTAKSKELSGDVSARLVSALVLSRLDYCNAVLVGPPAATLTPLQKVLRGGETRSRPETTRPCNSRP